MALSVEAVEAKRQYYVEYREKNRNRLNNYLRRWRKEHPDKMREYDERRWERKGKVN